MTPVFYADQARDDLRDIRFYIAADSIDAADSFIDLIEEKCRLIADTPQIGRARDDITEGIRSFPVSKYIVFYQPITDGIRVIRVLHAARDIPTLF